MHLAGARFGIHKGEGSHDIIMGEGAKGSGWHYSGFVFELGILTGYFPNALLQYFQYLLLLAFFSGLLDLPSSDVCSFFAVLHNSKYVSAPHISPPG